MSHDQQSTASQTGKTGKTVIRNIGLLLSGDIERPILRADTIVISDGLIAGVGTATELDLSDAATVIDANGCVVTPGLIHNHVHPAAGDGRLVRTRSAGSIPHFMAASPPSSPRARRIIRAGPGTSSV